MLDVLSSYLINRNVVFIIFFLVFLATYFILKISILLICYFILGDKTALKQLKLIYRSIFYIYGWLFISVLLAGWLIENVIRHALVYKVSYYNNLFMAVDAKIFGAYLPFWFQEISNPLKPVFDSLSLLLIKTYASLALFMGMVLTAALVKDGRLFYQMALTLGAVVLISLPFWYFFPAISPLEAYFFNILNISPSSDISAAVANYQPNQLLGDFFGEMKIASENNTNSGFLWITTLPSLHVAWALIIFYFGVIIHPLLLFVLGPYFILNFFSAIYNLQHYTIDLLAGIIVGGAAIIIVKRLSNDKSPDLLIQLSGIVREDIKRFIKLFKWVSFKG